MDNNIKINFNYINEYVILNWDDIYYGYKKNYLSWKDVIEFANYRLLNYDATNINNLELELSEVNKSTLYQINLLLDKLKNQNCSEEKVNRKWLYILLLNLFINKDKYVNVFSEIEKIYAEFDYPELMESFVPYMPPKNYDPENYSLDENIKRLYLNWEYFLNKEKDIYKKI